MDEGLLNDLLECSVCLERLDTSSRVLPCQHTFCLKCLKVIVESHKELRCPECRILVEVKVEELPPNVLLMRILEGMKNSAPRKLVTGQRTSRSGHLQGQVGVQGRDGKQLPPHARALHDYISKEPGDMSFKKGETILLQKKLDPFWYQGECSGRSGMFPITYVQVIVPLPTATALCKALYDFRMSAPDEEGCLAFDKGAIITVHRRVDDNWAEGRLEQRVGIFPIAFVELNQAARQLMNSVPLNRPVPAIPEHSRPSHSDHRHHAQNTHRYQPMSMSTPVSVQSNYQNMGSMSQSQPGYQAGARVEHTKHTLDLITFPSVTSVAGVAGVAGVQGAPHAALAVHAPRIDSYDRLRSGKHDAYSPATYQNHFPVAVAAFAAASSDSSSSVTTASAGASSGTPNTSSDASTCDSNAPSLPGSPDNNATVVACITTDQPDDEANHDESLNTSMGVLSLNESSTATNTSLNVSLPPSESPKLNASGASNTSQNQQNQNENQENGGNSEPRLDAPSSSKNVSRPSGPESLLTFGLGLQAALSPSHGKDGSYMLTRAHREHHHRDREKRHSLTPSTHLQANHNTPNRHSAEIPVSGSEEARVERRRRRSRSSERALPAPYVAIYPYKPQKPDELELKKGGMYTVTERCRDGWYKGWAERGARAGVFPGNYVAPAARPKLDKINMAAVAVAMAVVTSGAGAASGTVAVSTVPAPDAPPRRSPTPHDAQPISYPWTAPTQAQQTTPRSEKPKEKPKAEKSSISTGVSLMKRLAAMKKCKSPPPAGYSMDNPVFEDGPGTSLMLNLAQQHHPVHVRSGSCPSQLLRALPTNRGHGQPHNSQAAITAHTPHKERPSQLLHEHHHHLHRTTPENPWQTQHRKSQSLDVTATRRDRHHSQPVKERFRCIVPYPPNSEYELELKVDDIVIVSKKRGDGWYKGTLQRTGRTGLFPASFVQSCPE